MDSSKIKSRFLRSLFTFLMWMSGLLVAWFWVCFFLAFVMGKPQWHPYLSELVSLIVQKEVDRSGDAHNNHNTEK